MPSSSTADEPVAAETTDTTDVPAFTPSPYVARARDDSAIRAFLAEVRLHQQSHRPMIDVRSPQEYTGEKLHMPDYPQEGTLRGATFSAHSRGRAAAAERSAGGRPAAIYEGSRARGVGRRRDILSIGERSSHTSSC
jgi:thiosulfate/3-mercaptopyruvate sulfurtransferase